MSLTTKKTFFLFSVYLNVEVCHQTEIPEVCFNDLFDLDISNRRVLNNKEDNGVTIYDNV